MREWWSVVAFGAEDALGVCKNWIVEAYPGIKGDGGVGAHAAAHAIGCMRCWCMTNICFIAVRSCQPQCKIKVEVLAGRRRTRESACWQQAQPSAAKGQPQSLLPCLASALRARCRPPQLAVPLSYCVRSNPQAVQVHPSLVGGPQAPPHKTVSVGAAGQPLSCGCAARIAPVLSNCNAVPCPRPIPSRRDMQRGGARRPGVSTESAPCTNRLHCMSVV